MIQAELSAQLKSFIIYTIRGIKMNERRDALTAKYPRFFIPPEEVEE